MALRMKVLNAKGVVVNGRVRDLAELRDTGLPVSILIFNSLLSLLWQFGYSPQRSRYLLKRLLLYCSTKMRRL
jgi:hypothetical protein